MRTIKTLLTFSLILTSTYIFGQPKITTDNFPFIEVTGVAELDIVPDEIYISIELREKYSNKVKISIEDQEEKLKLSLASIGIDLSNLYLSDANADYVKVRWKKNDVLTNKEYTLKVSNATTLGKVFLELEKIEITDAYVSKVNHSKIDSLRKEIRIQAIKAAKHKADYLLNAIGEQTGKPLIINENENTLNHSQANVTLNKSINYEYDNSGSKLVSNTVIHFQKIKIRSTIYVKFTIK